MGLNFRCTVCECMWSKILLSYFKFMLQLFLFSELTVFSSVISYHSVHFQGDIYSQGHSRTSESKQHLLMCYTCFSRTHLDSWFSTGGGKIRMFIPGVVFYCFITNYHKRNGLKKKTNLLAHSSVNQKSRYSVAGLSAQGQAWLKSKCQLGCFLIWSLGSSSHPIQVISRIHTLQPEDWGSHFLTVSRELLLIPRGHISRLGPQRQHTASMFAFFIFFLDVCFLPSLPESISLTSFSH